MFSERLRLTKIRMRHFSTGYSFEEHLLLLFPWCVYIYVDVYIYVEDCTCSTQCFLPSSTRQTKHHYWQALVGQPLWALLIFLVLEEGFSNYQGGGDTFQISSLFSYFYFYYCEIFFLVVLWWAVGSEDLPLDKKFLSFPSRCWKKKVMKLLLL